MATLALAFALAACGGGGGGGTSSSQPPTLVNPGGQNSASGTAVSLQLNASDPENDPLTFLAAGLPPGLAVNSQGLVAGTPTTPGIYDVTASASDGANTSSVHFTWTVASSGALILAAPAVPAPTEIGKAIAFTASASGTNVLYKWDFGDGTPETAYAPSADVSHSYTKPGAFQVSVTANDDSGIPTTRSFTQMVHLPLTPKRPTQSTNIVYETRRAGDRLWVVNPDNDSVSVFVAADHSKAAEITVGTAPRSLAIASDGKVWVTNRDSATISVIDPATLTVVQTVSLPRGSMPFGIAMSPTENAAFVALEGAGDLHRIDTASYTISPAADAGSFARHVAVTADGANVYVSRFITPPLPGEATATVSPSATAGGAVEQFAANLSKIRRITLQHSDVPDGENSGSGIPNYLGSMAISPDGTQGWVPSKQDNIKRGQFRNGLPLNFANTVRATSSRVVLSTNTEDLAARVDHDNASMASAALFDPWGVYLFVALETSREVAVVEAHAGQQVLRFDVGRAPQGLALSPDGRTLYVHNFMDRSITVVDLRTLIDKGEAGIAKVATLPTVAAEKLAPDVLLGKQLFYDARDVRLARDAYMSCASCHSDGDGDGRVWDLTNLGEGLRNTIRLRGRAAGQGLLHWSANFDELQDFEGQIRALSGGAGLMSDADFFEGTRSQPLGLPKAGKSADLDALAAYVRSLSSFEPSAFRPANGSLSSMAAAGKAVFVSKNCASCHGGTAFTLSGTVPPPDIGTIKPSSGKRLNDTLTGIDIPTLRDVWLTGPYLHDGSAPTIADAIAAHNNVSFAGTELRDVAEYVREIGSDEPIAPTGP